MKTVFSLLRRRVVLSARLHATPLLITAALFGGGASAAQAQNCPAPAAWFPHAQTPPFDPNVFPDNDKATDCDFHRWAWQTFLYLTQEDKGRLRFLNYATEHDLFPADPTKKPPAQEELMATKASAPLRLKVRTAKPKEGGQVENAGSIFQAGSGGILVTQDGNPLFYSTHFNPVYYDFVEKNGYYDYETYKKASATTDFPPGAMELKAAWMIVPAGTKATGYTVAAEVPTLSVGANGAITAGEPYRPVTVALVGLHVVGVVQHHPEFIWATFENTANAPDLPDSIPAGSNEPVSSTGYTFYKANTPAAQCNVLTNVSLNAKTQTLSPVTQVFRQYTEGSGTPANLAAIYTLNQSVMGQLAPSDPCTAYNLIGGVWLLGGALQPNQVPFGNMLHGSFNLASSVMETFAQPPFPVSQPSTVQVPVQTSTVYLTSCFGCHNTAGTTTIGGLTIPPKNMNLSHILTEGLVNRQAALLKLKAAEQ